MSAAWVKMCFCLLSLGDFHSALSRAHSPGQGAPLLPPCAGESCTANVPGYDPQRSYRKWTPPLSVTGLNCILMLKCMYGQRPAFKHMIITHPKHLYISGHVGTCAPNVAKSCFRLSEQSVGVGWGGERLLLFPHSTFRERKAPKALEAVIDAYHWTL